MKKNFRNSNQLFLGGEFYMAKKGKLSYLDGVRGQFHVETHELPEKIVPGSCLVRIELCGVCATDVHYWMGMPPTYKQSFPLVYGHEFCGIVEQLGEGLTEDFLGRPLKVGDRIGLRPMQTCGKCYWCETAGLPMKCQNAGGFGDQPYQAPWFNGGFAQYAYIFKGVEIFKTDASPERAVMLEPLSIAVNVVNRVKQTIGDVVVVQGSGPIGLLTTMCAKLSGASKVIVVGGPEKRLAMAKEFGADMTINIFEVKDPKERVKMVLEQTDGGKGADVVYECVGFPAAVPEGIDYLRYGGTYGEAGHFANAGEVSINPALHLCSKCITLVGAWASAAEHFVPALRVLETTKFPIEKLITHKVPLERIPDAFECASTNYMLDGREVTKIAVDPWME